MLGDKISAEEAERMGMIYKYFFREDFEDDCRKTSYKNGKYANESIRDDKRVLNQSMTNTLEEQLALESKYQIEAAQSEDYAEGVAAFVEKRKPNFKGQ